MPKAVDDMASPKPMMSAVAVRHPTAMKSAVRSTPVTTSWASPSPKMSVRMDHRRAGLSSSPMMNRKRTMPSSATPLISPASVMSWAKGPITTPAAR